MASFFARMNPNQRLWATVGGVIVAGTVFKVAYFKMCRVVLVEQANKSHLDATEHYREAREFAAWSSKDREERRSELPPLTLEQEQQMRAYLRMMQEHHAFNRSSDIGRGD